MARPRRILTDFFASYLISGPRLWQVAGTVNISMQISFSVEEIGCTVRGSNPRFVKRHPTWSAEVHSKPVCEVCEQSGIAPDGAGCYYPWYYLSCGQHLETSEVSVLDGMLSRQ